MTYNRLDDEQYTYDKIYRLLLMSGEYQLSELDAQVCEIMMNSVYYPEYFQ